MILCTCHDPDILSIHKGKHRYLTACHKFFNDKSVSGTSKLLILHDLLNAGLRLVKILADQNSLSKSQSVCFQDNGKVCCFQIGKCCLRIIKILIRCCRNIVLFHKILGKCLASFQDRRIFPGSESPKTCFLQSVYQTAYQRIIHCHDRQINFFLFRKCCNLIKLHGSNRNTLSDHADTGIARCTIDLAYFSAFGNTVCDRVFSATAANDQNLHIRLHEIYVIVFYDTRVKRSKPT